MQSQPLDDLPRGYEPYDWDDLCELDKRRWPKPRLALGFTITPTQFRKIHDKHPYSPLYPVLPYECNVMRHDLCRLLRELTKCEDLFMEEPMTYNADLMVGMYTDVGGLDAVSVDTREREREIVGKLKELLQTDMPAMWYWLKEYSEMPERKFLNH